ncbi:meiotic recombination protein SPO11 [Daktulosphaira vitifoliae]|uniref:meiotic recombination protein SPO11 n=1 Tax=Daktulosphaira vitifoliae TaxID=58002 RepID=UPI0021AAEFAA|nr:meiotic recombination protein SPO11 [Daktulosphaira vitifoliae]XP_050530566.1 meiotic recombination protein SPO11 [Daktulosphaira vitifoliae]
MPFSIKHSSLLKKIENVILEMITHLKSKKIFMIQFTKCSNWSKNSFKNKNNVNVNKLHFQSKQSRRNFTIIIYVLSKIYQNISNHNVITTRELYYGNTELFENDYNVRKALVNISCLLNTFSWNLGLQLSSTGLVAGNLSIYMKDGKILDCSKMIEGIQIPQDILSIVNLKTNAKYILVIEKDASFQKIIKEKIINKQNECDFILVTGKGYPDINTRLFVKILSININLPILALVDANPFGIEIMCIYRFGSNSMCHQNDMLSVPSIKWLGVHPMDITSLNLSCIPMGDLDHLRIESLLKRPYINSNYQILQQILALKKLNKKSEIESLTEFTSTYLTNVYIKEKLFNREYY